MCVSHKNMESKGDILFTMTKWYYYYYHSHYHYYLIVMIPFFSSLNLKH